MKKEFSIYLDAIRFAAAFLVLIYHSNLRLLTTEKLPFSNHGHAAVIVFFVLSGYVISYITATKERDPIEYWSSRLSRFYSLAIPVVLLVPTLDLIGESLSPAFYAGKTTHDLGLLRVASSLLFLNEVWNVSIMSFSNVPYWSLCYEMWYYVLFAVVTFTSGNARIALIGAIALLLGPKIFLLAPIWVLGVALHRYKPLNDIPEWTGWLLFIASWPLYGLFQHYQLTEFGSDLVLQWVGEKWHRELTFSKFFLTDYLLAIIIASNFVGFRRIAHRFQRILLIGEKPIRWLSAYTFSLYILHQPLLQFFAALIDGDPNGRTFYLQVIAATLLGVVVIGFQTEHKRHLLRALIKRQLTWLINVKLWRKIVTPVLAYKGQREPT